MKPCCALSGKQQVKNDRIGSIAETENIGPSDRGGRFMRAIRLKTADLYQAFGIDEKHPRLSWNCEGGITQTACRIRARLENGRTVFDSGRVNGSHMYLDYCGEALRSRDRVYWKVCLWDETGKEEWSEETFFEMGLLEPEDWKAVWICGHGTDRAEHLPADYYRRVFTVPEKVKKARLYAVSNILPYFHAKNSA